MEVELLEPVVETKETPVTETKVETPVEQPKEKPVKADFKLKVPKAKAEQPIKEAALKEAPKEQPKVEEKTILEPEVKTEAKEVKPQAPQQAQPQQTDWKALLKNIDRKELLTELGIEEDDDFIKDFKRSYKAGVHHEYLNAKVKDWNKVDDKTLALQELAEQYPSLEKDELEILMNDKYKLDDLASDEEKKLGQIRMKADAAKKRQAEIEKQKKFTIPDIKAANPEEAIKQFQEAQAKQQQENVKKYVEDFMNHPSTKSILENKKVVVPAGKFGNFNLGVDADELVKYYTDDATFKKYSYDEKGNLDMSKSQQLAAINMIGLDNYNAALIKYGKQLATKELVQEGQNHKKETPVPPHLGKQPVQWRST